MSVTKNYFYNVLLIISNIIFPVITFPYVSRVLLPEYLGKIYFVQGIAVYFLLLSTLGAPNYGIKELSKAKATNDWLEFKKIFTELFLITVASSIFSSLMLLFTVNVYNKFQSEKIIFYIFLFQILFECFHVNHFFVVMEQHKRRLIRSFLIRIFSLGFLFYFVRTKEDYYIYALILVIPEVLARIIDVISIRKYFYFKNLNFKRHFKSMILIFMFLFTMGVYGSISTTMLGVMIDGAQGDVEVGLYSAAVKMYKLVLPVISTLGIVLSPKIIGWIKQKNKENIFKNINIFVDYSFIVGIPAVFLMMILAKEFVLLFSGENFEPAISTMIIMSPCLIFIALGSFVGGQIMIPNDMEKDILYISIFGIIINVSLNYFLIPIYYRNGAAIAILISEIIVSLAKIYKLKVIYPDYKIFTKDRIMIMIVGSLLAFVLYLNIDYIRIFGNFTSLVATTFIYGVIYFLILHGIKNERIMIWKNEVINKLKFLNKKC